MRKPAGTGFCWPMISFTLATALLVRLTGGVFLVTSGMVVVAIRISLALKLFDYSRCRLRQKHHSCGNHQLIGCGPQSGSRILPNSVTGFEQGISSTPRLANGAIIISIRASPELDAGCARPRSRSGK